MNLTEVQNKLSNLDYLLDRKLYLLEEVLKIAVEQAITFKSTSEEANTKIQKDIELKQNLIDELISIDEMFITIFKSFSGMLNENPNVLKNEILLLQSKIKSIAQVDLKIRVQEDKNKQIFSSHNNINKLNSGFINNSNNNNSNNNNLSNNNLNNISNNKRQSLLNKYQNNNL